MKNIVFFLEEPSAKEMLMGLLPRVLPSEVTPKYLVFQGKQDLEKNLVKKLRSWVLPESAFVVIRDQDAGDCRVIKKKLKKQCLEAGQENVLIRIACHELESFYLGDLEAVEKGLGLTKKISKQQVKKKFRNPDALGNPSKELEKLTQNQYQKVLGSRAIAPYLKINVNQSPSFNSLIKGLRKL